MEEADPPLLEALNSLRDEIEQLRDRIGALTAAVDELRGELIERGVERGTPGT